MSTVHSNRLARKPLAIGIAAAITLGGTFAPGMTAPAAAAPLSVNQTALKEAVPNNVVDVHRRYRRHHGDVIAGLALGVIGAVIAHKAYKRHRKYHQHYYHPYGYYGPPPCIRRHGAWYCR